jgi:tetratricopeptide (TPR) repeat protein
VLGLWLICLPVMAGQGGKCGSMPRLSQAQHQVMIKAQKLMAADNAKAGRVLAEYAKAHPKDAHCQFSFLCGVIAYQNKKLTQAKQHFSRAVELRPCHVPALSNLAVVTYELGDPVKAARLMIKAYENHEKPQPDYLYQAAAFYLAAKEPSQALPLLLRLADQPSPKPTWLKALVRTYLELKRYPKAMATLGRLLKRAPGDAELWRLSAMLNLEQENHAKAAADLEVSYRLSAPPPAKWRTLADLYRMAGAPLKAARYYRRSFGDKPDAKQLDLLAGVYFEANDLNKALQAARASIKQKPTAKCWRFIAQIHMQNKNYAQAMEAYEMAAGLAPQNARLKLMAGYCAMQMEDYQKALDHLSQAVARAKPGSRDAKEAKRTMNSVREYLKAEEASKSLGLGKS